MAQQQPDPATAAAANRDISAEEHMFSLFSKELGVSEAGSADAKPTPATEQPDTPAASGDVPADESPATDEAEATADGDEATPTPAEEAPAADPASADEHAKAGLRLEDYTRKTMEHAENVRKFEAERAQFEATQRQTLERYQERLAAADAPAKPLRLNATEAAADEWLIGFGEVSGDDTLSPSGDLTEAAARLFDALHRADSSDARGIAIAPIPCEGLGEAINDRLARAAQR